MDALAWLIIAVLIALGVCLLPIAIGLVMAAAPFIIAILLVMALIHACN